MSTSIRNFAGDAVAIERLQKKIQGGKMRRQCMGCDDLREIFEMAEIGVCVRHFTGRDKFKSNMRGGVLSHTIRWVFACRAGANPSLPEPEIVLIHPKHDYL